MTAPEQQWRNHLTETERAALEAADAARAEWERLNARSHSIIMRARYRAKLAAGGSAFVQGGRRSTNS